MKIGILGAGAIGRAFASQAASAGYKVILTNSRGPASLEATIKKMKGDVSAGLLKDVMQAEIIFISLQWQHAAPVLSAVHSWQGKIVVDAMNAILPGFVVPDLGGKTSSEVVEKFVAGAKLVKAFNTYTPAVLKSDPKVAGGRRVIFFSGNDRQSKEKIADIIGRIGFAGIDLGRLDEGGKLQQFPGGSLPAIDLIQLD